MSNMNTYTDRFLEYLPVLAGRVGKKSPSNSINSHQHSGAVPSEASWSHPETEPSVHQNQDKPGATSYATHCPGSSRDDADPLQHSDKSFQDRPEVRRDLREQPDNPRYEYSQGKQRDFAKAPAKHIQDQAHDEIRALKECIFTLNKELQSRDKSSSSMLNQKDLVISQQQEHILQMKQTIAALSRISDQVSDELLIERIKMLANSVQDWTLTSFRRLKFANHTSIPESAAALFDEAIPSPWFLYPSDTSVACQALVSKQLMHILDEPLYFGLSSDYHKDEVTKVLLNCSHGVSEFQKWRSLTHKMLRKSENPVLINQIWKSVDKIHTRTYRALCDLLGVPHNDRHCAKLRIIFENAVELHQTLGAQNAVYHFGLPDPDEEYIFDTSYLTDALGEENTELNGRIVHFATFPGVVKCGDERGENLDVKTIITKARVHVRREYGAEVH